MNLSEIKQYSPNKSYYFCYKPSSGARNDKGYLLETTYLSIFKTKGDVLVTMLEHRTYTPIHLI